MNTNKNPASVVWICRSFVIVVCVCFAKYADAQWTVTNLHPAGATESVVWGVAGANQVGQARVGGVCGDQPVVRYRRFVGGPKPGRVRFVSSLRHGGNVPGGAGYCGRRRRHQPMVRHRRLVGRSSSGGGERFFGQFSVGREPGGSGSDSNRRLSCQPVDRHGRVVGGSTPGGATSSGAYAVSTEDQVGTPLWAEVFAPASGRVLPPRGWI